MPIFHISGHALTAVEKKNFATEKELQTLIEQNLETLFNCRLVISNFSVGSQTPSNISTIALSEGNTPVIFAYKTLESSELINQSLFYSHLIQENKIDFEEIANNHFGSANVVDWSDVRVICIAPNYKPFDVHAAKVMAANLELWKYQLFTNDSFQIDRVLNNAVESLSPTENRAVETIPVEPAVETKPAIETETIPEELVAAPEPETLTTPEVEVVTVTSTEDIKAANKTNLNLPKMLYTLEGKPKSKAEKIKDLMATIRAFIMGLNPSIEEVTKKFYVAYKSSQTTKNFVCIESKSETIQLILNLKSSDVPSDTLNFKDVSKICHYGTGDIEFTVSSESDFEPVKAFIVMAHKKAGGHLI